MHVKREIAALIPPTKSRIQHLYIIVDILMLIICPFQNEIRVGDGVAWFSVLGWVGCWGSHAPHFQPSLPLFPPSESGGWYVPRKKKHRKGRRKNCYGCIYAIISNRLRRDVKIAPMGRWHGVWKMQQKIRQNWNLLNTKSQDGYASSHLALYRYFFNAYNVIKAM